MLRYIVLFAAVSCGAILLFRRLPDVHSHTQFGVPEMRKWTARHVARHETVEAPPVGAATGDDQIALEIRDTCRKDPSMKHTEYCRSSERYINASPSEKASMGCAVAHGCLPMERTPVKSEKQDDSELLAGDSGINACVAANLGIDRQSAAKLEKAGRAYYELRRTAGPEAAQAIGEIDRAAYMRLTYLNVQCTMQALDSH